MLFKHWNYISIQRKQNENTAKGLNMLSNEEKNVENIYVWVSHVGYMRPQIDLCL